MPKRHLPPLILTLFCLVCPPITQAEDAAVFPYLPAKIDLQDGDTFVF